MTPRAAIFSLLLLALAGFLAIVSLEPPAAEPANAPTARFSAGRAWEHVEVMAREPHPVGSGDHERVSRYILDQLRSLGLEPQVQDGSESGPPLKNILARLRGSAPTKAVVLTAHYDSVPGAPGAGDDAAGVAAILETLRALRSGPPLSNDVIALFTDGEEVGLRGARLFVNRHPWAREVGLVLNFEARGVGGPSILFETSTGNGRLIRECARTDCPLIANSFAHDVYRLLPNDTDLTVFKAAGLRGLNFAFIDGVAAYHTPADNSANLDRRSIQHHGACALGLTRHFGGLDLAEEMGDEDSVYFNPVGGLFIHYPGRRIVPLTCAAMLLFAILLGTGGLSRRGVAAAFIGFLGLAIETVGILTLAAAALHAILNWLGVIAGDLAWGPVPWRGVWTNGPFMLGILAAAVGLALLVLRRRRRRLGLEEMAAGALLFELVLLILASFWLRGATFLILWPLLLALPGFACLVWSAREPRPRWLGPVLGVCALPATILLVQAMYLVFLGMSHHFTMACFAAACFAMVLLGFFVPQLEALLGRR